jgi:hypothetical protein
MLSAALWSYFLCHFRRNIPRMRLIHSANLQFQEFFDSELPKFAILSHCWGENEVSYHDFRNQTLGDTHFSTMKKIIDCCSLAREAGLDWVWVDTCS